MIKKFKRRDIIILAILALLILLLPLFIRSLSNQRFEPREKAAEPPSASYGAITISPQSGTKFVGDILQGTISFTAPQAISSLSLRITYPYSGTTPELNIVDQNGNSVNKVTASSALTSTGDWAFPVNSVTRGSGLVTIDLAAINTSTIGFTSNTPVTLATFYFKINSASSQPITLTLDGGQSMMMTKASPTQNILDPSGTSVTYTLTTDNIPPEPVQNLDSSSASDFSSVTLSWQAPAEVGAQGSSVASYDIRYSTSPLSDSNWATATQATGEPTPGSPGTTQTFTISGLDSGVTYYFALKSTDSSGNISQMSNVFSITTKASYLDGVSFKMQGVTGSYINKSVTVSLEGTSLSNSYALDVMTDTQGVLRAVRGVELLGIPVKVGGVNYQVFVKDEGYLRKKLGSLTLYPGNTSYDPSWVNQVMLAGDFDSNNILNIIDIGKILSVYTALTVPVNSGNIIYDVDANNIIDIRDIAIVLSNYISLEVRGD